MIKQFSKGIFPGIIALSALSVSASAAFYSVSGLSKLFAGATMEVIIMAGSLEVAKLVVASLLYKYWDTLNKALRTYLTVATVVLVLITSMGIYGFLSAAYQDTYRQLATKENQTAFITQKKDFYEKDVIRYDSELERISRNISTLSNAKSSSIQIKDTSLVGGIRTTISTTELRMAAKRIEVEEENRKAVQEKRIIAADSLQKFQLQILELDNNTEVAGELGPLQYLSGLTGTPMDKIINVLLLIIIFVFDPLAIALVVAANFAFDQAYKKTLYDEFEDEDDQGLWEDEEFEDWDPGYEEYLKGTKLKTPQELPDEDEIDPPNEALANAAEQYKEGGLLKNTQRTLMTGYQLEDNIYQVRHKGPSMWKVELKTGEVVLVPKALAQKYLTQDPESSKSYM
tara:strand:+ start:468 stop:1667 length:1200 start_codon:yes stop_codon:yes gene_type:complete